MNSPARGVLLREDDSGRPSDPLGTGLKDPGMVQSSSRSSWLNARDRQVLISSPIRIGGVKLKRLK